MLLVGVWAEAMATRARHLGEGGSFLKEVEVASEEVRACPAGAVAHLNAARLKLVLIAVTVMGDLVGVRWAIGHRVEEVGV